jgi:hypothetical protein
MRQSGLAGIGPGGEPVGTDVGGGVGELANQRASRKIVKAIEVLVVVSLGFEICIAISELDDFQPAMGAEASVKSVIGRVADEGSVVWAHGKERRKAINESASEALVNSGLVGEVAIEIFRGVEGIVGFGDIEGENGGIEANFVPAAQLHGFWL